MHSRLANRCALHIFVASTRPGDTYLTYFKTSRRRPAKSQMQAGLTEVQNQSEPLAEENVEEQVPREDHVG